MQLTYQDRITLLPSDRRWLEAFAELYCGAQRRLYACIARGQDPNAIKSIFQRKTGLTARQFNAVRMELKGKIASTVALLKLRAADLQEQMSRTSKSIKRVKRELKKLKEKQVAMLRQPDAKERKAALELKRQLQNKSRRFQTAEAKLIRVKKRLEANVPGICFGSRKLFRQQFNTEQAGFGLGEEGKHNWRLAWRRARNNQFFLIGSKDEAFGNQSCTATVSHAPSHSDISPLSTIGLRLRMPTALIDRGAPKYIDIGGLRFEHGHEQVLAAIRSGTAISYRFYRDNFAADGWRVLVSTDVEDAPLASLEREHGVVGVDFNANHLAWSRVDMYGNIKDYGRVSLDLHSKSSEQREAIFSDAIDEVMKVAKKHSLPLAIEELDFAAKKRTLRDLGVRQARMLSGLAYSAFRQLVLTKAARRGVEVMVVNPAYTSVQGAVKYAARLGCTVHQAAAGVIARRAQGFKEKSPKNGMHRVPLKGSVADLTLPARNRREKSGVYWARIRKGLTAHCARQVRSLKTSSPGRPKVRMVRSQHLSADGIVQPAARESGKLLARRDDQLPDIPF